MSAVIDEARLSQTVIRVGDGRGFIVQAGFHRLIVTAAHCLPQFPPCHGASYLEERTYKRLLGPLSTAPPSVWAECLFADPIADIAVLGMPDSQDLSTEADNYDAFTAEKPVLRLGAIPKPDAAGDSLTSARLLTLDKRWISCDVRYLGELWIQATEQIRGGMSGSPICDEEGRAIGAVCVSGEFEGGPNPCLSDHLPGWLVRDLLPA